MGFSENQNPYVITYDEYQGIDNGMFIDIRSKDEIEYGAISDTLWIPKTEIASHMEEMKNKRVVLFDQNGMDAIEVARELQEKGINAKAFFGGYVEWVLKEMEKTTITTADIEQSIRKTYHKKLFTPFAKAINQYELLEPGDKVAVCISGGKDSMLMAKLFQELKRHRKFEFELVFLVMDPGYSKANRKVIEENAALMGIPITIFESEIFDAVDTIEKNPCYICARMRRGYLYSKAKELGCNKIALGHHYDDVIETILMGMLYGAQVQTMMPKLHSTNFEGMELIRPLYLIREDDIKRWRDANHLHFIQCACHFTESCTSSDEEGNSVSKRLEIKHLIEELKKVNPFVEGNIFKSVENVNLKTIIAYKENGIKHSFLETYDEKD
ncbi:MAG: ATPase [Lachnospiraceae bacterium]|nr:ATPase [Lachnospiraceae bacterium]